MYVVDILCIRDIYIYVYTYYLFIYIHHRILYISLDIHIRFWSVYIYMYRSRRWFWWVYDLHDLKVIRSFWMRSFAWINICISGWLIWLQTFWTCSCQHSARNLTGKAPLNFQPANSLMYPFVRNPQNQVRFHVIWQLWGCEITVRWVCFYVACTCMIERCKKMNACGPGARGRQRYHTYCNACQMPGTISVVCTEKSDTLCARSCFGIEGQLGLLS